VIGIEVPPLRVELSAPAGILVTVTHGFKAEVTQLGNGGIAFGIEGVNVESVHGQLLDEL
jgi:hypothetical protein